MGEAAANPGLPMRAWARMRAKVREAGIATMWLAAGFGIALISLVILLLVVAVALLTIVGIGLPLVRPKILCVRVLADLERMRLRALGHRVVSPYEDLPTAPLAVLRSVVTDPAIRRDMGWLACNATFGLALSVFGIQTLINAVQKLTLPIRWWLLPPSESSVLNGFVPVDSLTDAFLAASTGLVWVAIWLFIAPRVVRLQARPGVVLLNPHPEVDTSARVAQLTASRAAALDAHGVELRRIERALHDGAQNRLVGVALLAGAARQALARGPAEAEEVLERVQISAEEALAELRSVARSILPPVLENHGLQGAISALAAGSAIPCRAVVDVAVRGPATVEATMYFAVAEALTNASKHSGASEVTVDVRRAGDSLIARVFDNGRGGTDSVNGSGVEGIIRRVEALDGTTDISSPAGGPTVVTVELPCGS